jgi:AraC-like DNA-binding protein
MPHALIESLLAQLATPFTGEALFDALVDLVFFMKNAQGQYVLVNQTLAQRCGVSDKAALIGKTAADVFPEPLGQNYLAQDLALLETGEPLLNELELHTYPSREAGWCITTKLPLRGSQNECVGLVGISRDLHAPTDDYRDVAEAVRRAQSRLDTPLTVEEIATDAGLSAFQLDRRIREVFHLSTSQLLLKFRMDLARQRLRDTSLAIAHVALECGYADQSSFTRQFRRTIGLAPAEFRKRYSG